MERRSAIESQLERHYHSVDRMQADDGPVEVWQYQLVGVHRATIRPQPVGDSGVEAE